MGFDDLQEFLKGSGLHDFYPFSFPSGAGVSSVFNITGGTPERDTVDTFTLRILTRETHPQLALNKTKEVKEYLQKNLKGAFFDGKKILKVTPATPTPLIVGEEDGLYMVSWNYTILEG